MVLLGLVIGFQSGVLSDTRLAKPVDFDVSLRQITDFCAEVSSSSGVKFSVDKKVQDLKVDVFVDKRPLAETMDKVAKVLNCDWVPVEKGYRLEMDVKNINRERNFVQAEVDEEKKQLQTKMWAYEYIAKNTIASNSPHYSNSPEHFEYERRILEPFQTAVREAYATNDLAKQKDADIKRSAVEEGLRNFYFGRVLLKFDKNTFAKFWNGEPFVASTFPTSQYKLYESDMRNTGVHSYAMRDGTTVQAKSQFFLFFRYDYATGKIKANQHTYVTAPAEWGGETSLGQRNGGGFKYRTTANYVPESMLKMPFYEDLKSWNIPELTPAKFTQTVNNKIPTWESPWVCQRRRLGEHLRWFHMATNIPVVAQADRSCIYYWVKLDRGLPTATEYLNQLMVQGKVFAKEDSGFLMARSFRYWTNRQHEAPEAIWKTFEPIGRAVEPTLDEAAKVAVTLREDQIVSQEMEYPLSRFDLWKVENSYDSLRLYGSLSKAQRTTAQSLDGVRFGDLDSNQQQMLKTCVTKLIMESGSCSYELAKSLVTNGNTNERLRELRFKIKVTPNIRTNTAGSDLTDGEEVIVKFKSENYVATATEFRFEFSDNEIVSQSINIRQ